MSDYTPSIQELARAYEAVFVEARRPEARAEAARASLGSTSVSPDDAVMFEVMRLFEEHIRHLDRLVFSDWRVSNERKREVERLRHMIRESGKDPSDAPLWRRISEQRKEIRRLTRALAENTKEQ